MWKTKLTLAVLTAALTAGSAIQPGGAQGYNGGNYQYNDQYNNGPYNDPSYNQPYNGPSYNDQYNNPSYNDQYNDPSYDNRYNAPPQPGYRYSEDQDPYYRDCVQQRQNNTAGGLIIGALAGGALGNAVSRGPQRGAGTVLGAILGGAVGASVGNKRLDCEDRTTVYRTYYSGFERGRAHARYQWRSPRTDAYGYLEVGDYYRGPVGERCATYTQRIFVQGQPEVAAGHACRQPDGHWVLVD
jgi:surface antigen